MILAHGRDPYFDGWEDTAQLNYAVPETRPAPPPTRMARGRGVYASRVGWVGRRPSGPGLGR